MKICLQCADNIETFLFPLRPSARSPRDYCPSEHSCAKLAICTHNAERLEVTKKLCEEKGAEVLAYACDVADYDELVKFSKLIIE